MAHHDLVIRGGHICDGAGGPAFDADVAVDGGVITQVGSVDGAGRDEIDASGRIVTPGFVDIHTHYDGQATWTTQLSPSSAHGVTTAVMGNCGVGFAPCRPDDRDRLIQLMEGVEDIPFPVLAEGLPWNWESFPDYLDALSAREFDIDLCAQLPHAALRVFVMGERGANREPATPEDIAAMAAIAKSAVEAGALGFTTSRTLNHRSANGDPTPTLTAAEDELTGVALGLKAAGRGVLQVVSDFDDPEREFDMLRRVVEASGRPMSISLAQSDLAPNSWRTILDAIDDAAAGGLEMKAQVCGRPVGLLLGLNATLNPFSAHPHYKAIADQPLAARIAKLRDPDFRAALIADAPTSKNPFVKIVLRNFGKMYELGDPPNYEQPPERSLGTQAAAKGCAPEDLAIDAMLSQDGAGLLYLPFLNYADGSLDPSYDMLAHAHTVPGLSDGGAHVGMICDGSFPTSMLTHWTRDRTRGPKFDLEWVVKRQTSDTARAVGLLDRGYVRPGYRADLNIVDYDALTLHAPEIIHDLPAGGRRLMQRADGYDATIVAGRIVSRHGAPTGETPGRLVRGAQAAPQAAAAE